VDLSSNLSISKNSITTFVFNLADTLTWHDGSHFSLAIPAQTGQGFILWQSTTLADGSWQKVNDAIFTESDGQLYLTDPNPGSTRAFYRVQRDTVL
jgi:hypothetical protein